MQIIFSLLALFDFCLKNMDQTHVHLVITHLPIYGAILGMLTLVYGIMARSNHTKKAAYMILLIASLGGIVAYYTGESAEESLKNISGINKDLIEDHEASAK